MIDKRQIGRNAIVAVLQIVVNGVILFFLYRFFIKTIGAEQFGIWALVMAFTSFASATNLGFADTTVKFVAANMANNDHERTDLVIQTSVISMAVISGLVMLAIFPLVLWIIQYFVSGNALSFARLLLPYSFFSFWLMLVAGVFLSGLDGFKRTDIRGLLLITSNLTNLILCVLLVPKYGLLGIALSALISNACALVSSWLAIKKIEPSLPIFPYVWQRDLCRSLIAYALKFQVTSIAIIFFLPLTKALLGKYGSLSMLTYFEMSNRMILQFRSLLVSAYQVLVPVISEYKETKPELMSLVYGKAYELIFFLSIPVFAILIISVPLLSLIWIGYVENTFVLISKVLAFAWLISTLATPAYVFSLGSGSLKWNISGHIIIALLTGLGGYVLGCFFGGNGVLVSTFIAISFGNLVISVPVHLNNGLRIRDYVPKGSLHILIIVAACLVITQAPILGYCKLCPPFLIHMISISSCAVIIVVAALHPMCRRLFAWIKTCL